MLKNTPVLQQLLHFALYGPPEGIFTRMLIANLFFRLTHSQQAHQHLLTKTVIEKLIRFFNYKDNTHVDELHTLQ